MEVAWVYAQTLNSARQRSSTKRSFFCSLKTCCCFLGVKHQDSQNSFLAFLNAPTSALDQFEVSVQLFSFSVNKTFYCCCFMQIACIFADTLLLFLIILPHRDLCITICEYCHLRCWLSSLRTLVIIVNSL